MKYIYLRHIRLMNESNMYYMYNTQNKVIILSVEI